MRRVQQRVSILMVAIGWVVACAPGSMALAADAYPARPVKILTPTGPGGPSDTMIRGIAELLTKDLGQAFIVENRPGAEGILAGEACTNAAPDGYTLCLAEAFNTQLLPLTKAGLKYDPSRWTPVAFFGFLPTGLWSSQTVPANDAQEFLALAKKQPGTLTMGAFGRASSPYLHAEALRRTAGIDLTVVGYRSAVAAWQGTVSGEVSASLYGLQAGVPMLASGKVRLLAINTETRLAEFPNTPTFNEIGLQSGTMLWFALFAPPGTPDPVVRRINERIAKLVYDDPAVKERLVTAKGFVATAPAGAAPADVAAFVRTQRDTYAKWVAAAGVTPE